MKTIAIIGGMGPQASLHAHTRLLDKAIQANKTVNIVHVSLDIAHFHSSKPRLDLTKKQKRILNSIQADIGFISCNTAHHFFEQFQSEVNFKLISMLDHLDIPDGSLMLCSQTSSELKIFGDAFKYPSLKLQLKLNTIINGVINGDKNMSTSLEKILSKQKHPFVFGCTEISKVAFEQNINGMDTLEQTLDTIINTL